MIRPADRPAGAAERDACGTGFVIDRTGTPTHSILTDALEAVCNLEHRGAVSPDGKTSDGAGVMTQIPTRLFGELCDEIDTDRLAVGMFFLPREAESRPACQQRAVGELEGGGLEVLRRREVPFDE